MKLRSLGMVACMGVLASICLSSAKAEALLASVKTVGRALTQTAYPEDVFCTAVNPAGGAYLGNRYDAGIHFEHRRQSATIHDNNALTPVQIPGDGVVLVPVPGVNGRFPADKTKTQYLPDFGINKEFGCEGEYSLGFASFNRSFLKTTYNSSFPLFGTSNLGLEYLNHQLATFATYKINSCHAIGLAFNILITRIKVNGLERVAFPPSGAVFSAHPNNVTNKGYNWTTGYGATIGYLGKWTDRFSVGVSFTPEVYIPKYVKYNGFLVQGKLNNPWRFNAGFAYRFLPNATVALDYEHENWAGTRSLHNSVNNPNPFNPLLGTRGASGFGWRSRSTYRLGVDYSFRDTCSMLDGLTVRGGFRYGTPLFKKNQTVINALALETTTTAATCGFTYEYGCGEELSAYYGHLFYRKVRGKNSFSPLLGGGNADINQRQNLWGLAYGKRW